MCLRFAVDWTKLRRSCEAACGRGKAAGRRGLRLVSERQQLGRQLARGQRRPVRSLRLSDEERRARRLGLGVRVCTRHLETAQRALRQAVRHAGQRVPRDSGDPRPTNQKLPAVPPRDRLRSEQDEPLPARELHAHQQNSARAVDTGGDDPITCDRGQRARAVRDAHSGIPSQWQPVRRVRQWAPARREHRGQPAVEIRDDPEHAAKVGRSDALVRPAWVLAHHLPRLGGRSVREAQRAVFGSPANGT